MLQQHFNKELCKIRGSRSMLLVKYRSSRHTQLTSAILEARQITSSSLTHPVRGLQQGKTHL